MNDRSITSIQQSERRSSDLASLVSIDDLRVEHVDQNYHAWLNDSDVMRFLEARFRRHTLEDICAYVEAMNASKTDRIWRILCGGRHVGNIKLSGIATRHRRANLALLIGDRSVWGRGVGTQAIRLATAESFRTYDLFKIFAGFYAPNVASIRAFEKAGYVVEARLRGNRCFGGEMVDEILMACFRPTFGDGDGR